MSRAEKPPSRPPSGAGRVLVAAGLVVGGVAAGFLTVAVALHLLGEDPSVGGSPQPERRASEGSGSAAPETRPVFVDVTARVGLEFHHEAGRTGRYYYPEVMGAGCALFDFDGDGDLDVYFVNGNRLPPEPPLPSITNVLYRNDGDGTFTDVTAAAGVGDASYGQGCATADYDGDGDQDLYVTNFGPNVLYRNRGDGTFEAVEGALADPGWGQACAFFDADGDRDLDLYLQNYLVYSLESHQEWYVMIGEERVLDYCSPSGYSGQQDRLFLNDGKGGFRDGTRASGIVAPGGTGMGLVCADLDDDGDQDVVVSNDTRPNFCFRSDGRGRFTESALSSGLAFNAHGDTEAFMGIDVGDYDGDGRLDLVIPSLRGEGFNLFRNTGSMFSDVSVVTGIDAASRPVTGFAPVFLDYDSDGDLDLFFTTGEVRMGRTPSGARGTFEERYGMRDLLLENRAGRFVDVTDLAGGLEARAVSRACAAGDYDDDGDLDLLVTTMSGAARLLRNETEGGRWIGFRLEGRPPNRDAVGARLRLTSRARTQVREVFAGGSYLAQRDRRQLFGLGESGDVDELRVLWPGGRETIHRSLELDRYHTLREPGP